MNNCNLLLNTNIRQKFQEFYFYNHFKWVEKIQTAGYDSASTVYRFFFTNFQFFKLQLQM